ncbi:MAG: hypothetical protein V4574_00090 [Pseudomonadota bacterium]
MTKIRISDTAIEPIASAGFLVPKPLLVPANDNSPEPPPRAPARALLPDAAALGDVVAELQRDVVMLPLRLGRLDEAFFRDRLPRLNAAASRGDLSAASFAAHISNRFSQADLEGLTRIADTLSEDQAVWVLGAIGHLASLLVRHKRLESGDRSTSEGLALMPGLEEAMLAFGRATGRAPRNCAYSTWGIAPPWSFTGSEGERRFGEAVRDAERLLGEAARMLADLRTRTLRFVDATEVMSDVATLVLEYVDIQVDLAKRPFGEDFIAMRDYLAPFTVGGVEYEGPNATYTRAWTDLDLAVGLLGGHFRETASKRASYMPPREREWIEYSIGLPTLCDLVAETLEITSEDLATIDLAQLAARTGVRPRPERDALRAAAEVARSVARLSAVHGGAIRQNLTEPARQLSDEARSRLAVAPDGGVGGRELEHTHKLRDIRIKHPLVRVTLPGEEGK